MKIEKNYSTEESVDSKLSFNEIHHKNTCSLKNEEWLDSVQAAAYLKVSVGALRNMTSNGQIPFYKLGRRNRYRVEDLRSLLFSQKRGVSYGY